jgi:hypothetical protein
MRYPTRGYQRDPPSALLLRRPQEIYTLMEKPENLGIAIDMESHISVGADPSTFETAALPSNIGLLEEISTLMNTASATQGVGLRGLGGECLCQLYLSAMHSHFSNNPAIKAIGDTIDWRFWEIHIGEIDIGHRLRLRAAINDEISRSPELGEEIRIGYEKSKLAWDTFWTNIFVAEREQRVVALA